MKLLQSIKNRIPVKSIEVSRVKELVELVDAPPFEFRIWNTPRTLTKKIEKVSFVHVGKCGGTSVMSWFLANETLLKEYHLRRNYSENDDLLFTWVRNPIARYVSAFNHLKAIVNFNRGDLALEGLNMSNCPAPSKVIAAEKNGFYFSPEFDAWLSEFSNANELAESLTSTDKELRLKANLLMGSPIEHLSKGLGWYFNNGYDTRVIRKRLFKVGRLEYMQSDFDDLLDVTGLKEHFENPILGKVRESKAGLEKGLTEKAIGNIRAFYIDSDYKVLGRFNKFGLLDSETLDQYQNYSRVL